MLFSLAVSLRIKDYVLKIFFFYNYFNISIILYYILMYILDEALQCLDYFRFRIKNKTDKELKFCTIIVKSQFNYKIFECL